MKGSTSWCGHLYWYSLFFALKGRESIAQGEVLVVPHKFYLTALHGVTLVSAEVFALSGRGNRCGAAGTE